MCILHVNATRSHKDAIDHIVQKSQHLASVPYTLPDNNHSLASQNHTLCYLPDYVNLQI